jgi:hypothetical protein
MDRLAVNPVLPSLCLDGDDFAFFRLFFHDEIPYLGKKMRSTCSASSLPWVPTGQSEHVNALKGKNNTKRGRMIPTGETGKTCKATTDQSYVIHPSRIFQHTLRRLPGQRVFKTATFGRAAREGQAMRVFPSAGRQSVETGKVGLVREDFTTVLGQLSILHDFAASRPRVGVLPWNNEFIFGRPRFFHHRRQNRGIVFPFEYC